MHLRELRKHVMTFGVAAMGVGLAVVALGWCVSLADLALAGVVISAVGAYSSIYALIGSY